MRVSQHDVFNNGGEVRVSQHDVFNNGGEMRISQGERLWSVSTMYSIMG